VWQSKVRMSRLGKLHAETKGHGESITFVFFGASPRRSQQLNNAHTTDDKLQASKRKKKTQKKQLQCALVYTPFIFYTLCLELFLIIAHFLPYKITPSIPPPQFVLLSLLHLSKRKKTGEKGHDTRHRTCLPASPSSSSSSSSSVPPPPPSSPLVPTCLASA
jgi:hypothetical protein